MKKTRTKKICGILASTGLALTVLLGAGALVGCGPKTYDENAIVVSNYEELKTFLEDFSSKPYLETEVAEEGKYVVISNNIDCGGEVLTPLYTSDYAGLRFKFDGDGHTISNFKITEVCQVPLAGGSRDSGVPTLALFPIAEGGYLTNIEFKDFKYELTDADFGSYSNGIQVGLVGYSKSNGVHLTEDDGITTSTYKDVKITNMDVKITSSTAYQEKGYPFSVGALIGLDADSSWAGGVATKIEDSAVRENITVTNFNVDIDVKGGFVMVGGISGYNNWENVLYKNCSVNGTVKINNQGTEAGAYVRKQLGSMISVGGVTGGVIKNDASTVVLVENVKTDIDYILTAAAGDEYAHAGKFMGIVIEPTADAVKEICEVNIAENNTSTSTVKIGDAEAVAVAENYIAK